MRLGKKLKSGLKLGAKIAGGVIGTAGVIGAGLFALGSKGGTSSGQNALEDFNSGRGGIGSVSTADLDKLYPRVASLPQAPAVANSRPRGGTGSGLTQAQKDRDQAMIAMLNAQPDSN
tara:strand:+ start:106 stop:459 length:354 start_codon:yes stop_codon:yes gene_type:complete